MPLSLLRHVILVIVMDAMLNVAGCVTVAVAVAAHPPLSVTVIVYVPAERAVLVVLVPPPLQEYV